MKRKSLLYALLPLCGLFAATGAQAQSYMVTATCITNAYAYPDTSDPHSDTHTGPTSASAMTHSSAFYPVNDTYPDTSSAMASVQGQQGLITGSLNAQSHEVASASAASQLDWSDTLTIASLTLASGTPVSLVFLARYQASVANSIYNPIFDGVPSATTTLNFQSLATDTTSGGYAPLNFMATDTGAKIYDVPRQQTLSVRVGDTITLTSSVDMTAVGTYGNFGGFKVSTYANVNSFSSALFINAPSDVTVISASGHSYAATPAPGSLAIMAAGLFGVIFGAVRGRVRGGFAGL